MGDTIQKDTVHSSQAETAADDAASRTVLERVNASGAALLTHTVVDGRYVIRVAIGSVATHASDVTALWKRLSDEAATVLD